MQPEFPYDIEELKYIEKLIDKIPYYNAKIEELSNKIRELAKQADESGSFSDIQEIDKLITKAFFIDCENRPFNSINSRLIGKLKAEIVWHGEIKNRNIPCEICGENRSTDQCHIIPARDGGTAESHNLLILCPTHHRLFDKFMLSKAEWAVLDFNQKSEASRDYAHSVTLKAHEQFWEKQEAGGQPESIGLYGVDETPFIRYVLGKLEELFISGKPVKRSSIYDMLDPNIRAISKKVLNELIKLGYFEQIKANSCDMLVLGPDRLDIPEETLSRIWAKIK